MTNEILIEKINSKLITHILILCNVLLLDKSYDSTRGRITREEKKE
jgi:hypothetical protein